VCNVEKIRILDRSYDELGKNKRWVDEHGVQFNGRVCPDCHKLKMKERMKARRVKKEEITL
jgi:hypothetical protein